MALVTRGDEPPRGTNGSRGGSPTGAAAEMGRVPPHDLPAEKSVLSALLLAHRSMLALAGDLRPEDFYHPGHQILYGAMVQLHDAQKPVDLITLADHLQGEKLMEAVGGEVYLAELADFEATAANVAHHARIVHDKAVKRSLIHVATEIVEEGYHEGGPADQLLDFAA